MERYQGMVYSVAYNVLGNHTDAEDAAQEAFLRCYRTLPQYRGEATFSTWLFRLALTSAVDYKRRERRQPEPVETPDLMDEVCTRASATASTPTDDHRGPARPAPTTTACPPCSATSTACPTRRSPSSPGGRSAPSR